MTLLERLYKSLMTESYRAGSPFCQNYYKGPIHATPEEFESGAFTLKTRQMFYVHPTPEKFENATITGGRNA